MKLLDQLDHSSYRSRSTGKRTTVTDFVAAVNAWDDNAKLQWLKVQLTGRAQTTLKRLPDASYNETLAALKKQLEPESKRELYAAEFQTHRKGKMERWADFAEDLRRLANRAMPIWKKRPEKSFL